MNPRLYLSSLRMEARLDLLLPAEVLDRRVHELAEEIDRHYGDRDVLVVVVLRGAFVFAADLIRCMKCPVEVDFIRLESYGKGTCSSREVRVVSDLRESVDGREVLVVEDIIDSGWSLCFLLGYLQERGADDVKVCVLLDKPSRREADVEPDFVGFEVPDVFVVGYGIDYAQCLRSLPDIYSISGVE